MTSEASPIREAGLVGVDGVNPYENAGYGTAPDLGPKKQSTGTALVWAQSRWT